MMTLEELGSIINKIVEITFQFFCGFKKSQVVTKSKKINACFQWRRDASLSLFVDNNVETFRGQKEFVYDNVRYQKVYALKKKSTDYFTLDLLWIIFL